MKFGITTNMAFAPVVEVARLAESLGYESLWTGEHPIIPVQVKNPQLYGVPLPDSYKHMPNPFIWLTAAAVATTKLKVGMDVCLVPQRNPLILAKEIACLDRISNGRFLFGAGAGWIEEEAAIMGGYPFDKRWPRTVECIQAMKKLWTQEKASFQGEYVSFPEVYCYPKPLTLPHPPILWGAGNPSTKAMPAILRRTAEFADGWVPSFFTPEQMKEHLATLKRLCDERGRDFSKLDISLIVPGVTLGAVDEAVPWMKGMDTRRKDAAELVAEYEQVGVHRILVGFSDLQPDTFQRVLEHAARKLNLS
ncbi:MAG TPA: TIGR03619 family F420-dependent LLM class oxidoreductase [Steroidobacteraceae bacterium]|jgi:probable F420-dependent oxidoreductase|nr:TIGR03619 family F420-dependent LLM class oxidoreductase [Steroidobacteraceae bacterium]